MALTGSVRRTAAAVLWMLAPAAAAAQGLSIEHEPALCFVAGRPATLRACFVPISEFAAARVHFRPESRESWSQVAMRADAGCYAGVLPALGRELIGEKILYYIAAVDRASTAHRTSEFAPELVARAADCADRGAVAPPSGGGVSKAIVIGGVAAAGVAGAVIAAGGDSASPATTIGTAPTTTAPPATQPPVTPAPTPPPGAALALSCQADPRSGPAPLRIAFTAFPTGATGSYAFEWSFGDGGTSNNPNPSYTYAVAGRFDAVVRVTSGSETATCTRDITVTAPSGPGPTPTPTPTPTPPPPPGRTLTVTIGGGFGGVLTSNPGGINCGTGGGQTTCVWSFAHGTSVVLTAASVPIALVGISGACNAFGMGTVSCTTVMDADKTAHATFILGGRPALAVAGPVAVSSQLDVEGGVGRMSLNGVSTSVSAGPQMVQANARTGANLVEAVLATAAGRPGTWRFALGTSSGIKPGSLRVLAGTVTLITGDTALFRLEGKPGERVAFIFEVDP